MNLFQLVIKQMRQRALSTWLTLLSVMLGVGLAVSIRVFQREGWQLFGQSDYGYDLIVGPKGSPLQLVLNTVYHLDNAQGTIRYSVYTDLLKQDVRSALPFEVGDEYKGFRVFATLENLFPSDYEGRPIDPNKVFQYRIGRSLELAGGRAFHPRKFEAVIGSEVARQTGLALGGKLKVQHGTGGSGDIHDEEWTVVGILKPTRTAIDRVVYIPLVSVWAIPAHEQGMEEIEAFQKAHGAASRPTTTSAAPQPQLVAGHDHHDHEEAYDLNPDGTINLHLEPEKWKISGIMVRTQSGFQNATLKWQFMNLPDAMAVSPAEVMRTFYDTFLKGSSLLLLFISLLVTIVAAVSILVSIYNSISARLKEIAILRALGATRQKVLELICVEAGVVGLVGGVIGLLAGHALAGGGSVFLQYLLGQGIGWLATDWWEWVYLGVVVGLAVIAGLVPAMKAYRTPVADNLVAG
jgi:putative ABC transport system permease protein